MGARARRRIEENTARLDYIRYLRDLGSRVGETEVVYLCRLAYVRASRRLWIEMAQKHKLPGPTARAIGINHADLHKMIYGCGLTWEMVSDLARAGNFLIEEDELVPSITHPATTDEFPPQEKENAISYGARLAALGSARSLWVRAWVASGGVAKPAGDMLGLMLGNLHAHLTWCGLSRDKLGELTGVPSVSKRGRPRKGGAPAAVEPTGSLGLEML